MFSVFQFSWSSSGVFLRPPIVQRQKLITCVKFRNIFNTVLIKNIKFETIRQSQNQKFESSKEEKQYCKIYFSNTNIKFIKKLLNSSESPNPTQLCLRKQTLVQKGAFLAEQTHVLVISTILPVQLFQIFSEYYLKYFIHDTQLNLNHNPYF